MDEFETLLTSSRIAVDRWLKAHMGNCADAEDVLQETCLAAFQGFPRLQNKASFLPWILGIARRKCADWYRAQAKSKTVLVDHLPDQAEFASDDSAVNVAETDLRTAAYSGRHCQKPHEYCQSTLSHGISISAARRNENEKCSIAGFSA